MIWHLLYPFRGTTEVPDLPPDHGLRRAFSRYGTWAASHVKTALPLSVVLAFFLTYPMFFLYATDPTAVAKYNLPRHVWTELGEGSARPDVTVRSVWVYGSHMKALDRDLLLNALELQDELLGPTKDFDPRAVRPDTSDRDGHHIVHGRTDQAWFFHSPLQYWSGSAEAIAADVDPVRTANEKKTLSTSVNVTLRHPTVFGGKRFEGRRLVAADALVITLLHLYDSPVGRRWAAATEALARRSDRWTVVPPDGRTGSRIYAFRFRMARGDFVVLTLAYLLTVVRLVAGLSGMRALKSRCGLMMAMLVQMAASITSSFTVCAVLGVDVSRVPRYAYPIVVLAISTENSLRLVDAVVERAATVNTNQRIGEAFGATAHVALANRAGHFALLLVASCITYPGVAASCTFAAITIAFDFLYLSTFFLLVLKLDVRQRELSDMEVEHPRDASPQTTPRMGRTITPTRLVGTTVLVAFVLAARHGGTQTGTRTEPTVAHARSPRSWLHETAREVVEAVKPRADGFVARVHEPVVFVLKGSDRTPLNGEPVLPLHDFLGQIPLYLTLSLLTFFVFFPLTTYLAGDEAAPDESLISVRTLRGGHRLDVLALAPVGDGRLVSVGLDRVIAIWDVRTGPQGRVATEPGHASRDPFPVLAMAADGATWLALLSPGCVSLWHVPAQAWGPSFAVDVGVRPEAFFFSARKAGTVHTLVAVKRDGKMLELGPDGATEHDVCTTGLVWAVSFEHKCKRTPRVSVLAASRGGRVHLVTQQADGWASEEVELGARDVHCLVPVAALSMYLVGRRRSVDLVDMSSHAVLHTFGTEPMAPRSLRQASTGPRRLTLAYLAADSGDLVLQTYTGEKWAESMTKRIPNPGAWEALRDGDVAGVRRKRPRDTGRQNQRDEWEAWVVHRPDRDAHYETRVLDDDGDMLISEPGPVVKVGGRSLAVGFGDAVKVISVGRDEGLPGLEAELSRKGRRKKGKTL